MQDRQWKAIILECLAPQGIFYRQDTQAHQRQHLKHGGQLCLQKRCTWIIILGSIQIALTPVLRDPTVQNLYNKNFYSDSGSLVKRVADAEGLMFHPVTSATSASNSSAPRLLTGIWGEYTTGRRAGDGGNAIVSGLDKLFSVPYCSSCIYGSIANAELADHGLHKQDWRRVLRQGS